MDTAPYISTDDAKAVAAVSAIHKGAVEALRNLLSQHPELSTARIMDNRGVARTLLHIVADWPGHFPNSPLTAATLTAAGADVNAKVLHTRHAGSPETPLHWAASSDDVELIDALLDGGADIEAPGAIFTGGSPMSDAVVFAQWNAARRLLDRGAQTTIWQAAALGLLERVQQYCADRPTPPLDEISNAFWNACRGGQRGVAEYLLDCGAELNRIGHDRKTPLNVAEESGNADLVQWLRARGAHSHIKR